MNRIRAGPESHACIATTVVATAVAPDQHHWALRPEHAHAFAGKEPFIGLQFLSRAADRNP